MAGNSRVEKGMHYIVKKLTHHGKVETYNKTVSAIRRKNRHIKYLEEAKSLWSARKKTAELAIEKAETNWGKKLAQQRYDTATKNLDRINHSIAIDKGDIAALKASIKYQ